MSRQPNRVMLARLADRNRTIVAEELERRGGHCIYEGCGRTKIDWHHRDPATKRIEISAAIHGSSVATLTAELALCDPLCRRHHLLLDGRLHALQDLKRERDKQPQTSLGPNTKLTVEQVREIRSRSAGGETISALARAYSVTITTISNIVYRKLWAWVSD